MKIQVFYKNKNNGIWEGINYGIDRSGNFKTFELVQVKEQKFKTNHFFYNFIQNSSVWKSFERTEFYCCTLKEM